MAAACYCCSFSSSHGHGFFTPRSLTAITNTRSIISPSLTSRSRRSKRLLFSVSSAAPDPPLDLDLAGDEQGEDQDDWFQIHVSKVGGKRNRRVVRARVAVAAPLEAVWETLTDYEGLADFIPGLSECCLIHKDHRFARLYQVGEQDLALGFKYNAKGTVDCFEGEMELMPATGARRREIAFNMIDGDFKFFEGKWSVEEVDTSSVSDEGGEMSGDQEFQILTLLSWNLSSGFL